MPESTFRRAVALGVVLALLLIALPARALGDTVTFADLADVTIDADVHRVQELRRDGRNFSSQARQNWQLAIGADNTIDQTVNTTFRGPQGTRKAAPLSARFTLEETRTVLSRGGGQGAWTFADGTLTFVRTFPSGAYRAHFEFARGETGLTCKLNEAFARDGNKYIELESPFGGQVTILNSKQESSDCKVSKAP